ncbi:MAG TPA: ABC transporter ATP-binding protein [Treponema sp.]|jgi:putative ABC transport system ATP-binding protein|nr:ABC transporter ATP-binding protein [Treponema sp.]HBB42762.1 ABC transporter ATP-binding protein [Treponema sp.]HCA20319.1 ABC transporter ATP-binding protein [Treponema sp.]
MNVLEVRNLCKKYGDTEILHNVNFDIGEDEFVAIMGQSGGGKSTLLYTVSGMDSPDSGSVFLAGDEITKLSAKKMQEIRLSKMGFVFQKTSFLKNLSVADNIVYPAFQLGKSSRSEILEEAASLMEKMGISKIASRDISEVSGGQLQRAAICRAMINHPSILFGDELTGALNSSTTQEVMNILAAINRDGTAILVVTHDSKVAMRADRVIFLEDGNIKDVLSLGKYRSEDFSVREKRMKEWLDVMKF